MNKITPNNASGSNSWEYILAKETSDVDAFNSGGVKSTCKLGHSG